MTQVDKARIRGAVAELLAAIGEDPDREGLRATPERVAEAFAELFCGIGADPRSDLDVSFEQGDEQAVVLRDIPFASMCEHHLLPFSGVAHIGYSPQGRIVGLSKLARALETCSRRLQMQERLTNEVADAIQEALAPRGVVVVLEAEHQCMSMRGVHKPGTRVITQASRGSLPEDSAARRHLMELVSQRGI
ncbi:MAG: GTP cyclohydrolase I FolE [Chloroflexi bacterium]|nr:GTP cyclohydrolase I FolE [Chloroflexota bacterium]